jgi:hypothetical protein
MPKKQPEVSVRKEYYAASDGAYQLQAVAKKLTDPELQRLTKELVEKINEIQDHLSGEYNWD